MVWLPDEGGTGSPGTPGPVFSASLLFPELTVVVWTMVVGSLLSGRSYPVDQ